MTQTDRLRLPLLAAVITIAFAGHLAAGAPPRAGATGLAALILPIALDVQPSDDEEPLRGGCGIERPEKLSGSTVVPGLADLPQDEFHPLCTYIMRVVITKQGHVRDVEFLAPRSPDPRVAIPIRRLLSTWRWTPAKRKGAPVTIWYNVVLDSVPCRKG